MASGRIGAESKVKQNDIANENPHKNKKKNHPTNEKKLYAGAGLSLVQKQKEKEIKRYPGVDWWRPEGTICVFFIISVSRITSSSVSPP